MFDGRKDTNGLRNKRKTDRKILKKRKSNYLMNSKNTKEKIIKDYT